MLLRTDLHRMLVDAVRRIKPDAIHLAARCTGFDQDAGGVPLHFAKGSRVSSNALIAADGAHSRIRPAAFSPAVSQMPDVPTIAESGLPEFDVVTWNAIVTPADTPPEIVNCLARTIQDIVKDPAVRQRMAECGTTTISDGPAELRAFIQNQFSFWQKFVRESGLKTENQ